MSNPPPGPAAVNQRVRRVIGPASSRPPTARPEVHGGRSGRHRLASTCGTVVPAARASSPVARFRQRRGHPRADRRLAGPARRCVRVAVQLDLRPPCDPSPPKSWTPMADASDLPQTPARPHPKPQPGAPHKPGSSHPDPARMDRGDGRDPSGRFTGKGGYGKDRDGPGERAAWETCHTQAGSSHR